MVKWIVGLVLVTGIAIGGYMLMRSDDSAETLGAQADTTINIYFPIRPKSVSQFAYTEGVERTVAGSNRAAFAVEQLINGPSESEKDVGFYSALVLEGESNCGGNDFTIQIDDATKAATLTFCRELVYRNRGDFERVQASLARTMTELNEISSLIYRDATQTN